MHKKTREEHQEKKKSICWGYKYKETEKGEGREGGG